MEIYHLSGCSHWFSKKNFMVCNQHYQSFSDSNWLPTTFYYGHFINNSNSQLRLRQAARNPGARKSLCSGICCVRRLRRVFQTARKSLKNLGRTFLKLWSNLARNQKTIRFGWLILRKRYIDVFDWFSLILRDSFHGFHWNVRCENTEPKWIIFFMWFS